MLTWAQIVKKEPPPRPRPPPLVANPSSKLTQQQQRRRLPRPVADAKEKLALIQPTPTPKLMQQQQRLPLPDELIEEILSLLPVKSLVRFKCVCKSLDLIISDPQFVKLHFRRSSANMADLARIQLLSESYSYSIHNSTHIYPHVSLYSVPLLFSSDGEYRNRYRKGYLYHSRPQGFHLIGVCNGLVCFTKWKRNRAEDTLGTCVRLWNPATLLRSPVSPPLQLCITQYPSDYTFGFGYDRLNDTYKVVAVFYFSVSDLERLQSVVNVYDMGASCWRSIQSFPSMPREYLQAAYSGWSIQNGVYVSDTLNWVIQTTTNLFVIVSLDLGTEEHSQMSLPCFHHQSTDDLQPPILEVFKDSLCVLKCFEAFERTRFEIWQMKEFGAHDSWIQLFNFGSEEDYINIHPIGFILSENDEVLLISPTEQVLHDKRDQTYKFNSHHYTYWTGNAHNYVQSLVSPYSNIRLTSFSYDHLYLE